MTSEKKARVTALTLDISAEDLETLESAGWFAVVRWRRLSSEKTLKKREALAKARRVPRQGEGRDP